MATTINKELEARVKTLEEQLQALADRVGDVIVHGLGSDVSENSGHLVWTDISTGMADLDGVPDEPCWDWELDQRSKQLLVGEEAARA